jgi:hypothetical protein
MASRDEEDSMADDGKTRRIRDLNDTLRRWHIGGRIVFTEGIHALGPEPVAFILGAIAAFDRFNPDNDPYGEHDCAVMTVQKTRVIWKIDYYDKSLTFASSDPSDPKVTCRVMTVMLASEY